MHATAMSANYYTQLAEHYAIRRNLLLGALRETGFRRFGPKALTTS